MPVELRPRLPVLRAILCDTDSFLIDLSNAGYVQGVPPRPTVHMGGSNPHHMALFNSLSNLEVTLNPCRLKRDDPRFNTIVSQSPFGERHLLTLSSSLGEIYGGVKRILDHWGMGELWGCASYGMGGVLGPGASYAPGHVTFDWPKNGFPPVARHVYDAMRLALEDLEACIQVAEQHGSQPNDSNADNATSPPPPPNGANEAQYVTYDQMAIYIKQSKRTLERWYQEGKLPGPAVTGTRGKPHRWIWSDIRPHLEREVGRKLPDRFPDLSPLN